MSQKTAPLQEVFSSIQGEGPYVGKRQVFVRFAHCHLKCVYCDTPMTSATGHCHVEDPPGSGQIRFVENPMTPDTLIGIIEDLLPKARHHSVSFTGGEPLLYHGFLKDVFPAVRRHVPVYLETSGTQPEFLADVLGDTDIVAMDIKLPSATGEAPRYDEHARFYALATEALHVECFVKLVFNAHTTEAELEAVRGIITRPDTPLILQPVTDLGDRRVHVPPARILEIADWFSAYYRDVRVIPQTHKMLNVL